MAQATLTCEGGPATRSAFVMSREAIGKERGGDVVAEFADEALLRVTGGNGGHGCASIRREKFKPLGGPDGGERRPGR